MNAIFFGAKRAFHATLRLGRPLLARWGLTPARFDMLTAIWRYPCWAPQRGLRRLLGVSAATVSRMLRSLEQLGLIWRERMLGDTRRVAVYLTDAGKARIVEATRMLLRPVQRLVYEALVGPKRRRHKTARLMEMEQAEWLFNRLRRAFGDVARLHYDWHPDD
ncbi:MAG TPA: MarR family winged helix-turn-helix transcriptional regulator [Polyangiaceae bacterium]|nr:MarR family winged helix-turn-helix transcriptional regulator [Polyangiaceae bacterium]